MSASNVAAVGGEAPPSSTAQATARFEAAGLRSCPRCLSMSPPNSEGCTFCGQRFNLAFKRQAATMVLRAIVIPMVVAAVGACLWFLALGQSPVVLLGPH
ncbi:MAG: hypothetical protein ACLPYS_07855 [Vulcanimicrobiaceae bacterium]